MRLGADLRNRSSWSAKPGAAATKCPAPGALTATSVAAPRRPPDLLAELLARATSRYAALPPRHREVAQDAALALSLAVLNLLSLLPYQSQMHPLWLALLLVSAECVPLALRRVCPVPALIGCGPAIASSLAPEPETSHA